MLKVKYRLMNEAEVEKTIRRLAAEIVEKLPDLSNALLIGIKTRGVPLARRIQKYLETDHNIKIPVGAIDITFYRDDLSKVSETPEVRKVEFEFDTKDKIIILCDDVLYTGRTVRAALDEITDIGRPKMVKLVVLIDRGHRELPICADFIGKSITTTNSEVVKVKFTETDKETEVLILEKTEEEEK